jgi:hypothetical protein
MNSDRAISSNLGSSPDPLDFLVIGAQKCATSWLYDCLDGHPSIVLPESKKEVEYLGGELYEKNGADWYFGLIKGRKAGQIAGDVSVNYLSDPRSAPLVKQYLPNVRLVACLRDPIERAISATAWYTRKNFIPEAPVEEVLRAALKTDPSLTPMVFDHADLLYRGKYDIQLARYREFVSAERMHYVLYDEVSSNPKQVFVDLFKFLEVDATFIPPKIDTKPKHNTYFRPLILLQRAAPKSRLVGKFVDVSNQVLMKAGVGKEKPTLPRDLLDLLVALYEPHVVETSRLVNETRKLRGEKQVDLRKLWFGKYQS